MAIAKGLWDSWANDAFVQNKATGQFLDPLLVQADAGHQRARHRNTLLLAAGKLLRCMPGAMRHPTRSSAAAIASLAVGRCAAAIDQCNLNILVDGLPEGIFL